MGKLITDKEYTLFTQNWFEDKEIELLASKKKNLDFTKLEVSADFGLWMKLEIVEMKNNRAHSRSIEIPKEQAEKLLENMQIIVKRMKQIE